MSRRSSRWPSTCSTRIRICPCQDLDGERRSKRRSRSFPSIRACWTRCHRARTGAAAAGRRGDAMGAFAWRGLSLQGLYDRATRKRVVRSRGEGIARKECLSGRCVRATRLAGEALERYREARRENAQSPRALYARPSPLMLGRAREAQPVAEDLLRAAPTDVNTLLLVATRASGSGDPAAARMRSNMPARRAGSRRRPQEDRRHRASRR